MLLLQPLLLYLSQPSFEQGFINTPYSSCNEVLNKRDVKHHERELSVQDDDCGEKTSHKYDAMRRDL
jgi:hypothetical protein